jgi:hypothetical protein
MGDRCNPGSIEIPSQSAIPCHPPSAYVWDGVAGISGGSALLACLYHWVDDFKPMASRVSSCLLKGEVLS